MTTHPASSDDTSAGPGRPAGTTALVYAVVSLLVSPAFLLVAAATSGTVADGVRVGFWVALAGFLVGLVVGLVQRVRSSGVEQVRWGRIAWLAVVVPTVASGIGVLAYGVLA
ncbi:MAG TPA: hypothetical protein VN257_10960 [Actinotalea sp.]|nr:hypothetical protein [Actinotalea sp.]